MTVATSTLKADPRRCARRGVLCLVIALLALAAAAMARGELVLPPKPSHYVTDGAGILPADRASALNEKLASWERETSNQFLVWTAPSVPEGTTLEEFANKTFHAWGVGQKGRSNGLVLFVFPSDRKMRLEVGYGLEGAIPDALAHRITDESIKPKFKAGDYAAGIDAGVDAVFAAAKGEYKGTGRTAAEARPPVASAIPALVMVVILFGFFGLFIFLIVKALRGGFASVGRSMVSTGGSGWSSSSSDSGWSSSSDSSSSSSDSSSSSSFDSGGGDSGGGGSSDSW